MRDLMDSDVFMEIVLRAFCIVALTNKMRPLTPGIISIGGIERLTVCVMEKDFIWVRPP